MPSWIKAIDRLDRAYSEHSLRSYRSGFGRFASWCRGKRVPALPASPNTVAKFVDAHAEDLSPNTIRHRLSTIATVHRLCGLGDPTKDPDVELAWRRARRAKPSRPRQALGLTADLRDQLLDCCSDDLIGLRDRVLVSVGFDTLCRRGELVSIAIPDLTQREDGRYSILVRRAKNDPDGAGRVAHLSTSTSALVDRWLAAIGSGKGPLLRPVYGRTISPRHVDPLTVARVLKKLSTKQATMAGRVDQISGHSLRVGAAQQLAKDGHSMLKIMRVGGWKSPEVLARYVENMDIDVWD